MWPGPCCCEESTSSSLFTPNCDDVCDPMPRVWKITAPWDPAMPNSCLGAQWPGTHTVEFGFEATGPPRCHFNTGTDVIFPTCEYTPGFPPTPPSYSPCTVRSVPRTIHYPHLCALLIWADSGNREFEVRYQFITEDGLGSNTISFFTDVPLTDPCTNTVTLAVGPTSYSCDIELLAGNLVIDPQT